VDGVILLEAGRGPETNLLAASSADGVILLEAGRAAETNLLAASSVDGVRLLEAGRGAENKPADGILRGRSKITGGWQRC
jgi:hypothetical protein